MNVIVTTSAAMALAVSMSLGHTAVSATVTSSTTAAVTVSLHLALPPSATYHLLFLVCHCLSIVCCLPPVIRDWLSAVCNMLPAVYCMMSAVCCMLSIDYFQYTNIIVSIFSDETCLCDGPNCFDDGTCMTSTGKVIR